ncbi:MAG TPA: hypothetical protein VFE53_13410 [Mucilaginibacter sp.]|jgi:hypothetical protein|nr:hypothetical protein [Mucilaginibacter sp.]
MKKLLPLPAICLFLFGCADKKAQEQALLDSVIKVHNKVMTADEQVLKNKDVLDTLVKKEPTGALKDSAKIYQDKVIMADSAMDVWMHGFNPDLTTRAHDDNMAYLHKQQKLIMQVDSQMSAAVAASKKFISKTKTK